MYDEIEDKIQEATKLSNQCYSKLVDIFHDINKMLEESQLDDKKKNIIRYKLNEAAETLQKYDERKEKLWE